MSLYAPAPDAGKAEQTNFKYDHGSEKYEEQC
jgi:hypothetical protein